MATRTKARKDKVKGPASFDGVQVLTSPCSAKSKSVVGLPCTVPVVPVVPFVPFVRPLSSSPLRRATHPPPHHPHTLSCHACRYDQVSNAYQSKGGWYYGMGQNHRALVVDSCRRGEPFALRRVHPQRTDTIPLVSSRLRLCVCELEVKVKVSHEQAALGWTPSFRQGVKPELAGPV